MIQVGEEEDHHREGEQRRDREGGCPAVDLPGTEHHHAREKLDERIAQADPPLALRTATPQDQPRNHRYVLIPPNPLPTSGAARARSHDALTQREAMDTDVEKAADDQTDEREINAGQRLGDQAHDSSGRI